MREQRGIGARDEAVYRDWGKYSISAIVEKLTVREWEADLWRLESS
jgi:hypothetical protein